MIKAYRKLNTSINVYEVTTVNTDTLEVNSFNYMIVDDKIVKFSEYETDLYKMGYDGNIKAFQKRMKELNKHSFDINELTSIPLFVVGDYTEQQRKEFVKQYR